MAHNENIFMKFQCMRIMPRTKTVGIKPLKSIEPINGGVSSLNFATKTTGMPVISKSKPLMKR